MLEPSEIVANARQKESVPLVFVIRVEDKNGANAVSDLHEVGSTGESKRIDSQLSESLDVVSLSGIEG